jgi:tetratricopeptide (TPR) repeat protein
MDCPPSNQFHEHVRSGIFFAKEIVMTNLRLSALLTLCAVFVTFPGCSRDPSVNKQKYFESGNRYFEQGKYDEAGLQFVKALKIDPNFAAAHYQLAQTYIHLQAWPGAKGELQRTVELDPTNVKAQFELGNLLVAARSFAEAQAVADGLLKNAPDNVNAHVLKASLEFAQNDRDAAIQELQNAIALDATRPELYVHLAELQSAKHTPIAESTLKKALEIDPKFVPAIESLATLYQNTSRSSEAENLLKQAIELEPKNLQLRQQLARVYLSQDRKADAEQVMIRAKKDLGGEGHLYRVLGEYYVSVGEVDKASTEFAALSKQYPQDLNLRQDYIALLLQQNKIEEASQLNDEILKANPKNPGSQMLRGRILNLRGQFKEAIDILQAALKDEPNHAGGHYELGLALSRTGNLERAEEEWREAVKLEPRLTDAQLAVAQIALTKGDHDLLSHAAEQIIQSLPSDPRGYIFRAEAESRSGQGAAADADFSKAIQVAPQNPLGYSAMGGWLFKHDKLQEARKYYEQSLDHDPNYLDALNGVVAIFIQQKQNMKAQERVRQQIVKAPANDAFYALLGGLQAVGKDLPGAQASLEKAISLNPNNLGTLLLLSNVERAQGSTDKALATAYQSIEQHPKSVAGYFLAGSLEESRGNWQKAESLYQRALQVEPNYPPVANNLAYGMLEHNENTDIALSLAQIARQRMPESSSAADTLAWVYYQKGIYEFAVDLLREALQKAPDNATYHYHLGMVYQKRNNTVEAKKHLHRALEISPHHPDADKIREALNQMDS